MADGCSDQAEEAQGAVVRGYDLDVHTTKSVFLGYDAYGHGVFDSTRSPLGQLLYRLKYVGDSAALGEIAGTVVAFLGRWNPPTDLLVPVPPSNPARRRQPVMDLARAVCASTGIPLCAACITKVKRTPQLKDIFDLKRRTDLLRDAFSVARGKTAGRRLLLFDDLYRSGATVSAITKLLLTEGAAAAVYLLALTWTRRTV